jgi:hypothetical protein
MGRLVDSAFARSRPTRPPNVGWAAHDQQINPIELVGLRPVDRQNRYLPVKAEPVTDRLGNLTRVARTLIRKPRLLSSHTSFVDRSRQPRPPATRQSQKSWAHGPKLRP